MPSISTDQRNTAYVQAGLLLCPHHRRETVRALPPSAGVDVQGPGHSDEYIRSWQALMPLDARNLTPEQRRIILDKLYRRHFIVYDRLAEI